LIEIMSITGKKGLFIIAVLLVFVYGIFGIPHGGIKQSLQDRIHLGLDLKGGTHLVLQVHTSEAIGSDSDRVMAQANTALAPFGATAQKLDPANQPAVITLTSTSPTNYTLTMTQTAQTALEQATLTQSIETIRERIDQLGTYDPEIEQYGLGRDQILIELPGVSDPAKVDEVIHSTAKLEIHEVVGTGGFATQQDAVQSLGGSLPPDDIIVQGGNGMGGADQWYVLKRASVVSGLDFRGAQSSQDENGRPDIQFTLTTEAGDRFYKYTDANKGTGQMAVVLDNKIREVATIQSAIRDEGRITGGFSKDQADSLSELLRTGSLPASITTLETRSVGASLGASSIRQGVIAAVAGMLVVMAFMLFYYRGAGINADLALFLNLVILLGFMGFTGSTLTLPGIAGVILTIGMGVDSNVLIFERVREELRVGKLPAVAIQEGFAHAWTTIIDTHVTTIVSAAILFIFGTGPVKGFAVTLTFGLLANLFTAVFVSRTIFDWLLSRRERTVPLSI
jgi:preprotein translocase subunit SecD